MIARHPRVVGLVALAALVVAGCAPAAPAASQGAGSGETPAVARKRITAAVNSNPPALTPHVGLVLPGATEIEALIWGGLSAWDSKAVLHPQLGEAVPSIANGLWKLFPDGRMETTWRIKPGVVWHDSVPLTSEDLVFGLSVVRDREALPFFGDAAYAGIERVDAPDARTVTIGWKQPYVNADYLFAIGTSESMAVLLPKHLLEQPYQADKANFSQIPYWTDQFVGAGPYRVREFARDNHITLEAFGQYALGRPKIDEIEVQLILDGNTLMANLLAGTVEVTLGRGLSFEQGQALREQLRGATIDFVLTYSIMIYPQFLNASPAALVNPQFRRALIQGMDREEMANTLLGGISPPAHFRVPPEDPDYPAILPAIVQYVYDPRRATDLIEGLGYSKGSDGRFRDSASQPLSIEIRTGDADYQTKPMLAAANYWQQLGLNVDAVVVPAQRTRDLEYRATFPGLELSQQGASLDNLAMLRSDNAAVPENNFQTVPSRNYTRYANPEMDVLVRQYFVTVPKPERLEIARQIVHRVTDEVIWLSVYYTPQSTAISNRLQNVTGTRSPGTSSWNAQDWDVH